MSTCDELRRIALALPEAEERETFGQATFRVRDRIFAMLAPDGRTAVVKATPEEQALLLSSDPQTFAYAAYVGRFGWVSVQMATVEPDLLRGLLTEAWRRSAPKRLAARLGGGPG
jgi:hypothetical protein